MSTKMAASQWWRFGSRRRLSKSCLAGWSVQDICTQDLNRCIYRGGVPQDKTTWKFPCSIRGGKTLIKRSRGVEHETLKGVTDRPQTTAETADLHVLKCCTLLCWSAPVLPEALPCWTENFVRLAADPAPEILPCKTLTAPLLTVLSPRPADWDSGTRVHYPTILLCDVVTDCFWVIRIVIRLVWIWSEPALIKTK